MNKSEINKSGRYIAENVFISNNTRDTQLNNNDLIIGPSGSGKTGGYVIPAILTADHSLVIADTKNQLYKKYKNYLEKKGFKTLCVDFVHPEHSASYNPLDYIEKHKVRYKENGKTGYKTVYREQDYLTISRAIIEDSCRNEPFWPESSRMVLSSLIAYVCETIEGSIDFSDVADAFRLMNEQIAVSSSRDKCNLMMFNELMLYNPDSFAVKKYKSYCPNIAAEKCWGSICMYVANALDIFDYKENMNMLCKKSEVNFKKLGKEKTALFVNISDTDRCMDKIINLFYTQLFQTLCKQADAKESGALDIPVRIILDDFASNVYIPDFDKLMSIIRSRNIYASIILQSISQLNSKYDNSKARTIINNCDHIIYLGGQDEKTASFIGTKTGKIPDSILKMPLDKVWLLERGKDAILTNKIKPYSFDEKLKVLSNNVTDESDNKEGKEYE